MTLTSSEMQDVAAGGPKKRRLFLADGTEVIASISVRSYKNTTQQYGYLQFKYWGKTVTRYVGKVTADSKLSSLRLGWALVRTKQTAEANGWTWETPSPRGRKKP